MFWLSWWAWALLGIVLGIIEILAPSYMALGFGIGAGLVALGLGVGVLSPLLSAAGGFEVGVLLILFGLLSGLSWWGLRKAFGPMGGNVQTFEEDVND